MPFASDPNDPHRYDDIIGLPHHTSLRHPRMSAIDRAAQFSPFAALTGYDAAVAEPARLTDRRIEPDEDEKAVLDARLRMLRGQLAQRPAVRLLCFVPDEHKAGGAYVTLGGRVRRLDEHAGTLVLQDGTVIPIGDIADIAFGEEDD